MLLPLHIFIKLDEWSKHNGHQHDGTDEQNKLSQLRDTSPQVFSLKHFLSSFNQW
jgi:hypothetical protein